MASVGAAARLARVALILAVLTMGLTWRPATTRAALDLTLPVPYLGEGGSGADEAVNCGPAAVAMALQYSGLALPSVADVRATLGRGGTTTIGEWAALLSTYGAPYRQIWTRPDLDRALWSGQVVVVAVWMGGISPGPDYDQPWTPPAGQVGRYVPYSAGHALVVVGIADSGASYLVHDPNTFGDPTWGSSYWYADGTPKGRYRRYNADELWADIAAYGGGLGLAVGRAA